MYCSDKRLGGSFWIIYLVQNQDSCFPSSLRYIFVIPEGDLDAGFYEGILDYNNPLCLLTHRGSSF